MDSGDRERICRKIDELKTAQEGRFDALEGQVTDLAARFDERTRAMSDTCAERTRGVHKRMDRIQGRAVGWGAAAGAFISAAVSSFWDRLWGGA